VEGKVGVPELGPPAPDHGGQEIAVVEGFISRCIAFALAPDRATKPIVQQGMNHAVVKGRPIVVGDRLFVSLGLLEGLDRGGTDPRLNPGAAAACENQAHRNLAVFLQMVAERIGDTGPPPLPAGDGDEPPAIRIGGRAGFPASKRNGHLFAGVGRAPDFRVRLLLQDHAFGAKRMRPVIGITSGAGHPNAAGMPAKSIWFLPAVA
jgi:hypothetical protein